ncbi:hypothetical protein LJR225_004514 [Phenylobacterium sp. LjRoot225]|uniref:hypothetical protein n=1 Tax=Phenylobacterium sp. LjRoot225 TaxID=3342285 RepID=UPI003ECCAC04
MPDPTAAAHVEKRAARLGSTLQILVFAAPWIVFGPITGVMSGLAIRCFRAGQPVRGALWVIANICVVLSIPLLTAEILRRS